MMQNLQGDALILGGGVVFSNKADIRRYTVDEWGGPFIDPLTTEHGRNHGTNEGVRGAPVKRVGGFILLFICVFFAFPAFAQITVGVSLSLTGPAALLGEAQKNTLELLPRAFMDQTVEYLIRDDASDVPQAIANMRYFTQERQVDLVIGSTTSPNSLAMVEWAAQAQTPLISLAAASRIVSPVEGQKYWSFKTPQNETQMAMAIVNHMSRQGLKNVAFIGFSDAYGEGWHDQFRVLAQSRKIHIVASERFHRKDTEVTIQVSRIQAAQPQAVLIAASGFPALFPQKALRASGFDGAIYQTHGVAHHAFIKACGQECEGVFLPAGPVLVADQLPDSHPSKSSGLTYRNAYEAVHGPDSVSAFGGHLWDATTLLKAALPTALKVASPGTPAFRNALRDALEGLRDIAGVHGVFNFSPTDHGGLDHRSQVMLKIQKGRFVLAE
jgi:branched-chain amino acid transport system substrate-binding protein